LNVFIEEIEEIDSTLFWLSWWCAQARRGTHNSKKALPFRKKKPKIDFLGKITKF